MAFGIGAVLLATRGVAAQVPPPATDSIPVVAGDTIPVVSGDTIRTIPGDTIPIVPGDSISPLPGDTIPGDTLKPIVVVAPFRTGEEPSWTAGVWEWDRDALLRSTALTLTDLLQQIPGVTPIRSGFLGHPEAAALPGGTGGFSEIYLDGFALDPLDGSSYDLSRFELVQLNRVRVRRRGSGLRIDLETVAPTDHRPYTMIEAGTGDQGARLFRGTFMTPDFLVGPLALGIERLEGTGWLNETPANTFTGWLKWARGFGGTTLQLELRRNTVEWQTPEKVTMKGFRQDWMLRARREITPGLTADAFVGASALDDEYADTTITPRGRQGGVRAAYNTANFWSSATLRARDNLLLPRVEADIAAGVQLLDAIQLSGDLVHADWRAGQQGRSWGVRAETTPILGLRPFVEWSTGTRGIPGLRDMTGIPVLMERDQQIRDLLAPQDRDDVGLAILTERDAFRAGAEFAWRGVRLGAAWNSIRADSIADFGLPFDRTGTFYPGGTMQGVELTGRIPLHTKPFWLEGWYTRWTGNTSWIYLPGQSWRAALVYHDTPLPSGNLEVDARLEYSHRAGMLVPTIADGIAGTAAVPGLSSIDFYLQIRILDLRAFIRWNNITHQLYQHDLPGKFFPGQRTFYGIKWSFWN